MQPGTPTGDANASSTDAVQPDPAANNPAVASGQASPTELSFALRLTPPENAAPAAEAAAGNDPAGPVKHAPGMAAGTLEVSAKETATLVTAVKAAQKTEMHPDEAQPAARVEALVRTVAAAQTVETAASSGPQTEAHQPAAAAMKALDATPAQMQALDQTPKPAGPMKNLSIQVGQTQTDRVEVRVVEHAGELQVAVHAANPEVAQGLRQGLSDLSDRLEQNGFRAEAWRPGSPVSAVQGTGETRQRSTEFQNDGSPSQQGGSRQGQQQHSQQQGQRPRWVQELEGSLITSSTGDSYGIPR